MNFIKDFSQKSVAWIVAEVIKFYVNRFSRSKLKINNPVIDKYSFDQDKIKIKCASEIIIDGSLGFKVGSHSFVDGYIYDLEATIPTLSIMSESSKFNVRKILLVFNQFDTESTIYFSTNDKSNFINMMEDEDDDPNLTMLENVVDEGLKVIIDNVKTHIDKFDIIFGKYETTLENLSYHRQVLKVERVVVKEVMEITQLAYQNNCININSLTIYNIPSGGSGNGGTKIDYTISINKIKYMNHEVTDFFIDKNTFSIGSLRGDVNVKPFKANYSMNGNVISILSDLLIDTRFDNKFKISSGSGSSFKFIINTKKIRIKVNDIIINAAEIINNRGHDVGITYNDISLNAKFFENDWFDDIILKIPDYELKVKRINYKKMIFENVLLNFERSNIIKSDKIILDKKISFYKLYLRDVFKIKSHYEHIIVYINKIINLFESGETKGERKEYYCDELVLFEQVIDDDKFILKNVNYMTDLTISEVIYKIGVNVVLSVSGILYDFIKFKVNDVNVHVTKNIIISIYMRVMDFINKGSYTQNISNSMLESGIKIDPPEKPNEVDDDELFFDDNFLVEKFIDKSKLIINKLYIYYHNTDFTFSVVDDDDDFNIPMFSVYLSAIKLFYSDDFFDLSFDHYGVSDYQADDNKWFNAVSAGGNKLPAIRIKVTKVDDYYDIDVKTSQIKINLREMFVKDLESIFEFKDDVVEVVNEPVKSNVSVQLHISDIVLDICYLPKPRYIKMIHVSGMLLVLNEIFISRTTALEDIPGKIMRSWNKDVWNQDIKGFKAIRHLNVIRPYYLVAKFFVKDVEKKIIFINSIMFPSV